MEISPISGIRVMPALKPRPNGTELTAAFDIERAVRPDEDADSRSGKKAAGTEEENEEQTEESAPEASASKISFFA